ncbi:MULTISPECIES: hypothetical protein [Leeuwenhoekiella]|nr:MULTISPECIES: hypothetical protein [Leeuwenhoekiella]HBT11451.1 hypothetical protein [Leeuwenhoekiella sp.]
MKKLLLTLLLCIPLFTNAQMSIALLDPSASEFEPRYALAINGSSLGGGLEVARSISEKFNLRIRANSFNFKNLDYSVDIGNTGTLDLSGNARMLETDLSLEFLPFKKASFKLVGGLGYFFNALGSVNALYAQPVNFGQITITPDQFGTADLKLDYSGLSPYLGLGFGRAVPKNRVGLSVELGTFYLSEPDLIIDATKMLSPLADQAPSIELNISDYRWYPFLNLKLAVKI